MNEPTPVVLAALALVLTGPAPLLLARAEWPNRVPRAALVLWQALAAAAVLSALGAGLSVGLLIVTTDRATPLEVMFHVATLLLTVVVLARLVWSAHTFGTNIRIRRRRHRELVDLVGRADQRAPGAHVLQVDPALAYCIPGLRPRLVVSAAALVALQDDELHAVLEHERAHVRARHDLVLEGFSVLHNAFPKVVRSRAALDAAAGLVEMLADDAARRRVGSIPLARALVTLADAPVPAGSLGSGAVTPLVRVRRLAEPVGRTAPALAAATYLAAAALFLVPTVTVAAPWLTDLVQTLG
jgi:Zn-dependent protease with chaperone function